MSGKMKNTMNPRLLMAVRTLLKSPKRAMVAIAALAIGILGVGSVLVAYTILTRDLDANFQRTVPLHAVFELGSGAEFDLEAFRNRPEVESAEFRAFSLQRVEARPNVWIPIWIFGVSDFGNMRLAKIFPEEGEFGGQGKGILIERNGQLVSDLEVGKMANIRVGGELRSVPVKGIVFDPAQAPATQESMLYAYADHETFTEITGEPSRQRLIFRMHDVSSAEELRAKAKALQANLEAESLSVVSLGMPPFNQHPHQWQLNTILVLFGSIGFLAFAMSIVFVTQLMRSIMASQVRQIGILKTIGGQTAQIFQIYSMLLLLMGLAAALIAVPFSLSAGSAFSYFVAAQLNFNILTTSLPPLVYVLLVAGSLFSPLLFSLPILLKGTRISIRQALTDYGISAALDKTRAPRFSLFSGPFLLALRNAARNPRRLTVTLLTMSLGVAIFSTGFNARASLKRLLTDLEEELRYDVQVALTQKLPREEALRPFKNMPNVAEIELWSGGSGALQSKLVGTERSVGIVALPQNTDLLRLKLVEGHWIKPAGQKEIVMNQAAWKRYGYPEMGSELRLNRGLGSTDVRLVGVAKQFDRAKIYMDIAAYDSVFNPDRLVNTLVFVAEDRNFRSVMALKGEIEKALAGTDFHVLYVMSEAERVQVVYAHLDIILVSILLLSFLVLVVSAFGMASATGINIWERSREIGVMRAIGATPKVIYRIFVFEGMIVGGLSVLLGLAMAYPLSLGAVEVLGELFFGESMPLELAFSGEGLAVTLLVTLAFSWLASRLPARAAVKVAAWEVLGYE